MQTLPRSMIRHQGRGQPWGFTLIEILVTLAILTLLVSIVTVNVMRKPGEARRQAVRIQIKTMQSALKLYRVEQKRYPTQEQGIEALVEKPLVEPIPEFYPADGYLDSSKLPSDPWDNEYIYLIPGHDNDPYEVISYGADGEPGGEGEDEDVSSADL